MGWVLGGSWVCSWPIRTNVQQRPSQHRRVLILQSMCLYICILGTSLVVQGVRLHLPAQGVGVQSLVRDHVPQSQKTKTEQKNIVTSSINTLKMVHNDNNNKNLKKKREKLLCQSETVQERLAKGGTDPKHPLLQCGGSRWPRRSAAAPAHGKGLSGPETHSSHQMRHARQLSREA